MFKLFNSISELADTARKSVSNSSHWGTVSNALPSFVNGDESLVPQAEALMNKIEDESLVTTGKQFQPHVFGPYVSVPDYLTGTPTPFRHMRDTESEQTPIRIVASICSSAAITRQQLRTRGLAISALVMKLQAIRPVELIVFTELEGDGRYNGNRDSDFSKGSGRAIVALQIESKPLSLAHAINILSNSDIARILFYGITEAIVGRRCPKWPEDWRTPAYDKWLAEQFQLDQQTDIVVPSVYATDSIINNPIGWINDNLSRLGYREE